MSFLCVISLNLYDYLKDRHFRGLSLVEINYMARQLLSCLSFLKQQVRGAIAAITENTVCLTECHAHLFYPLPYILPQFL